MTAPEDGWRRAARCDNSSGNCVEIKAAGSAFAVRDSKDPDGPLLLFAGGEFMAFVGAIRNGEFDDLLA